MSSWFDRHRSKVDLCPPPGCSDLKPRSEYGGGQEAVNRGGPAAGRKLLFARKPDLSRESVPGKRKERELDLDMEKEDEGDSDAEAGDDGDDDNDFADSGVDIDDDDDDKVGLLAGGEADLKIIIDDNILPNFKCL